MKQYIINKQIKKGLAILQLEAEEVFKYGDKLSFQRLRGINIKDGVKKYSKKTFLLNYSASIPYSLELNKLYQDDKTILKEIFGIKYTNAVISLMVTKSYKKWNKDKNKMEVILNTKNLREEVYKNGFNILDEETGELQHYVFYKRSSSSARQSKCLFIKEQLLKKMYRYSFLDLNIKEGILNELLTYSSLTLSSLSQDYNFFKLNKNEILIINDIYKKEMVHNILTYKATCDNKDLVGEKKDEEKEFNQSDGEGLMDVSVFKEMMKENPTGQGMMLIRNNWLKCCVLSTNMQQYFDDNNIKYVYNMFGKKMKASKIKLIITPSSLKFMKLANQFFDGNKEECFNYWLDRIDYFGICKVSYMHKYKNRLTYQFLNAYNFSEDEIYKLAEDDIKKVDAIRTDIEAFKAYINEDSNNVYTEILNINSNFQFTKLYKNKRNRIVTKLVNEMRKGKLTVSDSNYYTVFSVPELLLQEACRLPQKQILQDNLPNCYEICCTDYDEYKDLVCFRNPFVNKNSSCIIKNCSDIKMDFYKKYFNIGNESYCIICTGTSICLLCSGMDFDSDTVEIINNKIIYNKVKETFKDVVYLDMDVQSKKKIQNFDNISIAVNDDQNSKNYIGQIVNLSCKINTYCNHILNTKPDNTLVDELMNYSNKLSLLSNIEIDKAKKSFLIDSKAIIKKIADETELQKPLFFKYTCSKNKKAKLSKNKNFREYNSAMDKLNSIIKSNLTKIYHKKMEIADVMTYEANKGSDCRNITRKIKEILFTSDFVIITLKKMGEDVGLIHNKTIKDLTDAFNKYTLNKDMIYKILKHFNNTVIIEALYESRYKDNLLDLFR